MKQLDENALKNFILVRNELEKKLLKHIDTANFFSVIEPQEQELFRHYIFQSGNYYLDLNSLCTIGGVDLTKKQYNSHQAVAVCFTEKLQNETASDGVLGGIFNDEEIESPSDLFSKAFFKKAVILELSLEINENITISNSKLKNVFFTQTAKVSIELYDSDLSNVAFESERNIQFSVHMEACRANTLSAAHLNKISFLRNTVATNVTLLDSQMILIIKNGSILDMLSASQCILQSMEIIDSELTNFLFENVTFQIIDIKNVPSEFSEICLVNDSNAFEQAHTIKVLASPHFENIFNRLKIDKILTIRLAIMQGKIELPPPLLILVPYSLSGATTNADKLLQYLAPITDREEKNKNYIIYVSNTDKFSIMCEFFTTKGVNPDLCILPGGENIPENYYSETRKMKSIGDSPKIDIYDVESLDDSELNDPRTNFELCLLDWCVKQDIPAIGICRGLQLMAVFFGMNLLNTDDEHTHKPELHQASIFKITNRNNLNPLFRLLEPYFKDLKSETIQIRVSCQHTQKIMPSETHFPSCFESIARSFRNDEHVIESAQFVVKPNKLTFRGTQFHPESVIKDAVLSSVEGDEDVSDSIRVLSWMLEDAEKTAREKLEPARVMAARDNSKLT